MGVVSGATPDEALGEWTCSDPVAACVPDLTRALDLPAALAALGDRLPRMTTVVGLGLHRRMSPDELAPIAAWGPVQHDLDDVVPTSDVDGIPGEVTRTVAECAWSVAVGVAELHQYAGVSGGHKAVAIGCGGRATISSLHRRASVMRPGVRLGGIEGNPFREAVDALGEAAGCGLAVLWVPAAGVWLAGDPRAAVREALRRIDPWVPVDRTWPGAVLRVPPSKARSFYQASRAFTYLALSPAPPVAAGGVLALDASCPEGPGAERGFAEALRGSPPPWAGLLVGPEPAGDGAQRAVMIALALRHYRLRVHSCADPDALGCAGIDATPDPPPAGPDWLDIPDPFNRLPQRSR